MVMTDFFIYTGKSISDCVENEDTTLVNYCNHKRKSLPSSPTQSNFRVYCLLIVKTIESDVILVDGTNGEQGFIGGAICAERSALLKLRTFDQPKILKVIVTTDSQHAISPGVLCREFLMSSADISTMIVMGNHDDTQIKVTSLESLYPFPYLYRLITRHSILSKAKEFSSSATMKRIDIHHRHHPTTAVAVAADDDDDDDSVTAIDSRIVALFNEAMKYNVLDDQDSLHPIRFSAAVMFPDHTIKAAWQLKGLEYGCTLDPITQLIHYLHIFKVNSARVKETEIEERNSNNNNRNDNSKKMDSITGTSTNDHHDVTFMLMTDQFGVCHAPFAQARALLTEHGFGHVKCVIHDERGDIHIVEANDLVPHIGNASLLSHEDFQ